MKTKLREQIYGEFEDFGKDSTRIDQDCIMQEDWHALIDNIIALLDQPKEKPMSWDDLTDQEEYFNED